MGLTPSDLQTLALMLGELGALDCLAACLDACATHSRSQNEEISLEELVAAGVPVSKARSVAAALARVQRPPVERGLDEPKQFGSRIDTLAFPIAHAMAHGSSMTESATSRLWNMQLAHEQLMRLTTLVLLADLHSCKLDSKARLLLAKNVRRLRSPCRGDWYDAMYGVASVHRLSAPDSLIAELSAAAVGFSKVQASAAPDIERSGQLNEALLWLRNAHFAHAGTRRDVDSERLLPVATKWVQQMLQHFDRGLDSFRLAGQHGGVARWLHGPDAARFSPAPSLPSGASNGSVWVVPVASEHAIIELGPLVEALDSNDPVGCHDGFTQKRRVLLGVRTRTLRNDISRLDAYLHEFDLDLRLGRDDLTSWGLAEWAEDMTRSTLDALRGVKYIPEVYVERPTLGLGADARGAEDTTLRFLQHGAHPALLIEAEPGAGKTSLFCWLAERLLGQQSREASDSNAARPCVVLVLGESMRCASESRTPIFDSIGAALHLQTSGPGAVESFVALLDVLRASLERDDSATERPMLVLVDAVNESNDPRMVLDELAGMAAAARGAWERAGNKRWIRIVASVRRGTLARLDRTSPEARPVRNTGDFETFVDADERVQPWLSLRPFTNVELQEAYELAQARTAPRESVRTGCRVPYNELPECWQDLLRHPLHLSLFHEAFADLPAEKLDRPDVYGLWKAWIDRVLVQGHARSVYDTALTLIDAALEAGTQSIPAETIEQARESFWAECGGSLARLAAARSPVETLEELGVLRRQAGDGRLTFRNDATAECLAEEALRRRARISGRAATDVLEADLTTWWGLPASPWMDGAVARLAAQWFEDGQPKVLRWLADSRVSSGKEARHLLERVLRDVLPRNATPVQAAQFEGRLKHALLDVGRRPEDDVPEVVTALWNVVDESRHQRGAALGSLAVAQCWVSQMEKMTAISPGNTSHRMVLSIAYRKAGELLLQHDTDGARSRLLQSTDIAEDIIYVDSSNTQCLSHLSTTYVQLGNLLMASDPNEARHRWAQSRRILEHLSQLEPENCDYLREIGMLHIREGDAFQATNWSRADSWYRIGIKSITELVERDPENVDHLWCLSLAYRKLGVHRARSQVDDALQQYDKCLEILTDLHEREPGNAKYLQDISASFLEIGKIASEQDAGVALRGYTKSAEVLHELLRSEPENIEYLWMLSNCLELSGEIFPEGSREQSDSYARCLGVRFHLVKREPQNSQYVVGLRVILERDGDALLDRNSTEALQRYEQSLELAELLVEREPHSVKHRDTLSSLCNKIGSVLSTTSPTVGEQWCERGRKIKGETEDLKSLKTRISTLLQEGHTLSPDHPEEARLYYEQALELQQELARREPESVQHLIDVLGVVTYLNNVARRADVDDAAKGRERRERRRTALEAIVERLPQNVRFMKLMSEAHLKSGEDMLGIDPARARVLLGKCLRAAEELAEREPWSLELAAHVIFQYIEVGHVLSTHDPVEAQRLIDQAIDIAEKLATLDPGQSDKRALVSTTYVAIGALLCRTDSRRSHEFFERGLSIAEDAASFYSTEYSMLALSEMYAGVGDELVLNGHATAAEVRFLRSLVILEELVERSPQNLEYLASLGTACISLGESLRERDPSAARSRFEQSLKIREELVRRDADNARHLQDLEDTRGRLRRTRVAGLSRPLQVAGTPSRAAEGHAKLESIEEVSSRNQALVTPGSGRITESTRRVKNPFAVYKGDPSPLPHAPEQPAIEAPDQAFTTMRASRVPTSTPPSQAVDLPGDVGHLPDRSATCAEPHHDPLPSVGARPSAPPPVFSFDAKRAKAEVVATTPQDPATRASTHASDGAERSGGLRAPVSNPFSHRAAVRPTQPPLSPARTAHIATLDPSVTHSHVPTDTAQREPRGAAPGSRTSLSGRGSAKGAHGLPMPIQSGGTEPVVPKPGSVRPAGGQERRERNERRLGKGSTSDPRAPLNPFAKYQAAPLPSHYVEPQARGTLVQTSGGGRSAAEFARAVERALEAYELEKARRTSAVAVALGRATPAVQRFYTSRRPAETTLPEEGWQIRKDDWQELIAFGVGSPPLELFDTVGMLAAVGEIEFEHLRDPGPQAIAPRGGGTEVCWTFVVDQEGRPPRSESFSQPHVNVGAQNSAHLRLDSAKVSRMHAHVDLADTAEPVVMDLGSVSGTFLNGRRVSKARFRSGDQLTFGDVRVVARIDQPTPVQAFGGTRVGSLWTKRVRLLATALGAPAPRLGVRDEMTRAVRLSSVCPAHIDVAAHVLDQGQWEMLRPELDLCIARTHMLTAGSLILRRPDHLRMALGGLGPLFGSRTPLPASESAERLARVARTVLSDQAIERLRPQFLSLPSGDGFNRLAADWLTSSDLTVAHAALILYDDIVPILAALPHYCLGNTSGERWNELVWALADHFMSDDYVELRQSLGLRATQERK